MKRFTIPGIVALALMAQGLTASAGETFSIAAVADPQYADVPVGWRGGGREPEEGVNRLSYAVSQYNQRALDWGVIVGDIIDFDDIDYGNPPPGTPSATGTQDWSNADAILGAWDQLNILKYMVLGNHEFYVPNKDVDGLSKPYSVYRKFGFDQKAYYSFRHKDFRFIVLDGDFCYLNFDPDLPEYQQALDYYNALSGPQKTWWNAAISVDQRIWLMNALDESSVLDEPVVIMCHYPIHNPIGHHSLLNSTEMLDIVNGYSNVVMWLNGHNHSGDYALEGRRHHVNLKGMQNEAENWYEIEFSPDRVLVYKAEETNTPVHDLDISRPPLTVDPPYGFVATNAAGVASLSWNAEPAGVTAVVIEARRVPTAEPWQVITTLALPTGGSYGHTPTHPAAEYKYRIRFEAGAALSRYSEVLSPGEAAETPNPEPYAGLIGWWQFDDGTATNAVDSSGNGYDLDRVSAAGSWITGKADGAYNQPRFTANAAESDILNLAGESSVSLSVWVPGYI
ncbi:MAG: metallophosphoesterase [Kiritimatiellae bacterium]|nr:metallophosphoesterase [Kiritimatiellia bacterium]